jgi:hypothetical protein
MAERRDATLEELLSKPPRTKELILRVPGDVELVVRLQAIGAARYDELLAEHPPTKQQKTDGMTHNPDTFPPALIAECLVTPHMNVEEATQLWTDPAWSRGELSELFYGCVEVNSKGLDVPFT